MTKRQLYVFIFILFLNAATASAQVMFTDVIVEVGLGDVMGNTAATWGDYDDDGDIDILVTTATEVDPQTVDVLYRNEGGGAFIDVAQHAGVWREAFHKNAFFWDYDNDGDLDIFTGASTGGHIALYRNHGTPNHWLQLKLIAAQSNRDAIGARVTIVGEPIVELEGGKRKQVIRNEDVV